MPLFSSDAAAAGVRAELEAELATKATAAQGALAETAVQPEALATAIAGAKDRTQHIGTQAIASVSGLQSALDSKLEQAAIANFETTLQLNARDTANRSRANHTGTQPASTITGLAAVATSGSFGDLSGRPKPAFTYDQQTEPSAPAAGVTWRERSAGGLILGEWEWSGSVWVALQKTTVSGVTVNGAATAYPSLPFEAPRCLFVQCRISTTQQGNPATPFNSTNYRELFLARSLTTAASAVFTFRPLISLAEGAYVSPMNYLNPAGASFFTGTTVVGSPGTMHAPGVSWVYREVRA